MRLSRSEQTPEGNIPVALFNYGETRKFVRVWDEYGDTIDTVCVAFGILGSSDAISLHTSSLDICMGRDVAIDKSAYPLMWTFLDEMTVRVAPKQEEVRDIVSGSSRSAEKAPERIDTSTSTPPLEIPESAEDTNLVSSSIPPKDTTHLEAEEEALKEQKRWEERIWEEEVNEDIYSPIEFQEGTSNEPDKDPEPKARAPKMRFKAAVINSPSSSTTTHDDIFPRVKQENNTASLNEEARHEKSPRKETQATLAEDPRFEITIVGPWNAYAQFKTRGKHPVRKVLAAACKLFDMDESRTQLVLNLSVEDEEGEIQSHDFMCGPEETIHGCGVNSGSKLFLRQRADVTDDIFD